MFRIVGIAPLATTRTSKSTRITSTKADAAVAGTRQDPVQAVVTRLTEIARDGGSRQQTELALCEALTLLGADHAAVLHQAESSEALDVASAH